MIKKVVNIINYFVLWLVFFEIERMVFLFNTSNFSSEYSFFILLKSMMYGLWLDISICGYFSIFFVLVNILALFYSGLASKIVKIFNYIVILICTIIVAGNDILYTYWATPLDYNALIYLKTPTQAVASISWLKIILPVLLCVLPSILLIYLLKKLKIENFTKTNPKILQVLFNLFVFIFLTLVLILPVRGGIGIVPVNLSKVYFHKDIYPNHAAYNPVWNVMYSLSEKNDDNNYYFMNDKIAEQKFKSLFNEKLSIEENDKLLNNKRPNVILIVLESYLHRLFFLKHKGIEVIPNLNKINSESIFFSKLYASGDRSDRGLVSIFSGYPALPKSAIVQFPQKFEKIPSLFKDFEKYNYSTSFYYGGNLDFANLRSYFISIGVNEIVSENDFTGKLKKGKWGVHDQYTLERFYKDLKKQDKTFFASIFTLSNHEPYDLPVNYFFGNNNADTEYMSAARYTDSCIGNFIDSLKSSNLWENTLLIITSDHGVAKLGINEMQQPEKFHIPMIWTGGAIKKPMIIDKICSQTDIPLMILDQCGILPAKNYKFSNSIFRKGSIPFASYFFNNGFGFLRNDCASVFDNVSGRYWTNTCQNSLNGNLGKAYLQVLSKDFNK